MAGRLTDKTYRQTETATKRETKRRDGLGKEGRDLKNQGAEQRLAAAMAAAGAQSLVLTDESQVGPDGRITKFDSV